MPERIAVVLADRLRTAGLVVPVGATLAFAESLALVDATRRRDVYWAGRATLTRRPEDAAAFDRAFAAIFGGDDAETADADPPVEHMTLVLDAEDVGASGGAPETSAAPELAVRYSAQEVLRAKDFAACTPAELEEAHRLMAELRLAGPRRRSRRLRRASGTSGRPDLRRTVRHALRTGGEPISRPTRNPSTRPRRLVFLLDISGSMAPYARALLRFVHAGVAGRSATRVEAFALGTRLTRLTRALTAHDPDAAMAAAARAVPDWSGGTRLGDGLRAFNDDWGVRGMARGAVVVILSDGWDRGDPVVLSEQVRRLGLVAHEIVWVNPLKAAPGFAPIARGMAAALPHVDRLVEGHSLNALSELAEMLSAGHR